ncbi:MAG: ArnT family glycosyltransferase [Betaproteobacteria bacterium]
MTAEASPAAISTRKLWLWYAAAAAAFIPAIGFHYVGEEAIFPKSSLEMWFRGEWVQQFLVGLNHQHNPLFNWIIIAVCRVVGWEWMLEVARTVAIGATVSTGLVLAWLALRVFEDRRFAAWTAVVYLMLADVTLYRGWLAYVDPLFGLFVFSAVACLWVACRERRAALLALAVAALVLGFLAKAFTAFVFYGIAVFVLLIGKEARRFLLGPASLAIHAAGIAAVAVWVGVVPANEGQGPRMFREIVGKLGFTGMLDYLAKLVVYPLETALKAAPAALLALYYGRKRPWESDPARPALMIAAAITALNYLPYWLAPQSHTRYLVPLFPLAALVFARVIWSAGLGAQAVTIRWCGALLAIKLTLVLAVFPYYQKTYRGENYALAAKAILERTRGHALYTTNVSASGLSVAANLDVLRLTQPPLAFPPAQWEAGFVIAYTPDEALGRVAEQYRLGGNVLYLICRGAACRGTVNDQAADTAGPTK